MTLSQFEKTGFGPGDALIYDSKTYEITGVDFEEMLFGIREFEPDEHDDGIRWKRCEHVEFIPYVRPCKMDASDIAFETGQG